jgi:hypothetical protein
MTEMMSDVERAEEPKSGPGLDGLDEQLVEQLVGQARAGGLQLTGEGGLLQQLTKRVLESALEGETGEATCKGTTRRGSMGPDSGLTSMACPATARVRVGRDAPTCR